MDRGRARFGFTIVEVLAVVAILALLMGLLLPALAGAKKTSLKTKELNSLRQIGVAWSIYANSYNDACLPGYLDPAVQEDWNLAYEFPDTELIPPIHAAPWTLRLAPLLEFSPDLLLGYDDSQDYDRLLISEPENAAKFARRPAFGYNALYVGGWWEMQTLDGREHARPRYYDVKRVVSQRIGQIQRASGLVVFCSSAQLPVDTVIEKPDRNQEGFHWVSPSIVEGATQWRVWDPQQSELVIEVVGDEPPEPFPDSPLPCPIGRYTGNAAVVFADLHTDAILPGTLTDQRFFIDRADAVDFTH